MRCACWYSLCLPTEGWPGWVDLSLYHYADNNTLAYIQCVSKKLCHFYALNNLVKHWQILIIFSTQTLILSLHYLVKCRSHSLDVYNNEFILDSACISSEKSLKPQNHWKFVIHLTLIVLILRLYIDELKWHINSEWATMGQWLLNALLASGINVHRLCLCWRKSFEDMM